MPDRPFTAMEMHRDIQKCKKAVDEAIADLLTSVQKKLEAVDDFEKAVARARILSATTNPDFREADHKAFVSQATDKERFNAALQKEMLRVQYKVLESRQGQLSATQTDAKVLMQEMRFAQTGPAEF